MKSLSGSLNERVTMSLQYLCEECRLGSFRIHRDHLFEDYVRSIFHYAVIVKAERNFIHGDVVEYTAFHPDLCSIPEGQEPPMYQIFLNDSGKIEFSKTTASGGFPSSWIRLGNRK